VSRGVGTSRLHQVVSELKLHLYISGEARGKQEEDKVAEDSVR
jgi:hypothetical protein